MGRDPIKNLQWNKGGRAPTDNKIGYPAPNSGSDGDVQIKQTTLGARLFGRIGGRWYHTPLAVDDKVRFGTARSDQLVITNESLSIFKDNKEVANFGSTITLGDSTTEHVEIASSHFKVKDGTTDRVTIDSGGVTVPNIYLSGRINLTDNIGNDIDADAKGNIMLGTENLESPSQTKNHCWNNISIGYQSMKDMVGGGSGQEIYNNVAIGTKAMKTIVNTGHSNVAIGSNSLQRLSNGGGQNVCVGTSTGGGGSGADTAILRNTCIGHFAGRTTKGDDNIFIGYGSGLNTTTGSNNIAIGKDTICTTSLSNIIVIGDDITGYANDFRFGKASNVVANDFDTDNAWTHSSDERKKTDIKNDTLGLSFINDLQTKTFKWKPAEEHPVEWHAWKDLKDEEGNLTGEKEYHEMNTTSVMHGLIAQNVKSALDTAGVSTFGGWKERTNGEQTLSTEMFVYPLIKAIQELSAKLDTMQTEINKLKAE